MVNETMDTHQEVTDSLNAKDQMVTESMPGLTHHQTPLPKNSVKRLCSELSPLGEGHEGLDQKIDELIEKFFAIHLPKFATELKKVFEQCIKTLIDEHLKALKDEVNNRIDHKERQSTLRSKCDAEVLESYNRREILRIMGIEADAGSEDVTASKVVEVATKIGAKVSETDISIAHRLLVEKSRD